MVPEFSCYNYRLSKIFFSEDANGIRFLLSLLVCDMASVSKVIAEPIGMIGSPLNI